MKNYLRTLSVIGLLIIFIGISANSAVSNVLSNNRGQPTDVFVDDDFDETTPGWGYDHFDNIQDGLDNVTDYGTIHVSEGSYDTFIVQGRSNIIIESVDSVMSIVQGNQNVIDYSLSPPSFAKCVIFVENSENIVLSRLDVQGVDLTGRSYGIFYNDSIGVIDECNISPNQRGNMNSLGVRAQLYSELSIENCTILNYGRIGIYARSGTIVNIYRNTILGQIYSDSDGDFVSYGVDIEDLIEASHADIRFNEIKDHDHTGNPTWSSAAIIIDAWRYYDVTPDKCSAIVEYNDIHENMLGLQIVPNENIKINFNKIYNNRLYGAVSDPYWDGTTHVYVDLNAVNNWWGEESGPYHPSTNPDGTGNQVTDYVIFTPWKEDYLPGITITTPQNRFLYFNFRDFIEFRIPFITTFIIGKNEVKTEVSDGLFQIEKVEFYVDGSLKYSVKTEPYEWTWNEITPFFPYKISTIVYDTEGNTEIAEINVWKTQSFKE